MVRHLVRRLPDRNEVENALPATLQARHAETLTTGSFAGTHRVTLHPHRAPGQGSRWRRMAPCPPPTYSTRRGLRSLTGCCSPGVADRCSIADRREYLLAYGNHP